MEDEMARKSFHQEPEPHERWMVSYADFITLLFAFFVVMYAISSVQDQKVQQLSDSIGQALGRSTVTQKHVVTAQSPSVDTDVLQQSAARRQKLNAQREHNLLKAMALALDERLSLLVKQGRVRVSRSNRGIVIEINASILFSPADARLNSTSTAALASIAEILRRYPNLIEVEGHTDNRAIETHEFPSNWELSAARASCVVRLMIESGIEEGRLKAIGHAANRPVASNETSQGRLRNRRVEIQVLSGDGIGKSSSVD
jgi:chemotaxis protein MotB